ncbi:MAG: hypothetical protein KC620_20200 [Myxococcales bacterium]|nr:hypothetical protein [Myxococcales bacterium]
MSFGIPFENQPTPELLTAGQPSDAQFAAAAKAGYTTAINLRGFGEEGVDRAPKTLPALGYRYVHIPVAGPAGITLANAKALHEAMQAAEGKTIVYCASSNRVGALLALSAFHFDGRSAEEALAFGRKGGLLGLEPLVRAMLRK